MHILIANTVLWKKGNIGYRYGKILDELNSRNIPHLVFARSSIKRRKEIYTLGIFSNVPRVFNAWRIYVNRKFNHRIFDCLLFEGIFIVYFLPILFVYLNRHDSKDEERSVLLQEFSPAIIGIFKIFGFKVVLDTPIAPNSYAKKFIQEYGENRGISFNAPMNKRELRSFQKVDEILVPSDFVYSEISDLVPDKPIHTVYFGTNIGLSKIERCAKSENIKFCFAGVINKRKGIEYLLQAWLELDSGNCELHLCGRVYPEIRKILSQTGYENVVCPGFVDTTEYFNECDVYVFPSLLEGSSKSIYEAMSAGLPVICTTESGSIVRDGIDGYIVEKCDVSALKQKMQCFIDRPHSISRMGKSARQKVEEYSWDKYANEVIRVL